MSSVYGDYPAEWDREDVEPTRAFACWRCNRGGARKVGRRILCGPCADPRVRANHRGTCVDPDGVIDCICSLGNP